MSTPAILRGIQYAGGMGGPSDDGWSRWIANFEYDGGVLFACRDDCVFIVRGYDAEDHRPHVVRIAIDRASDGRKIWAGLVSSLYLSGMPELVWGEVA